MNIDNLPSFAYAAEEYLPGPQPWALCVTFPGLGSTEMRSTLDIPDIKTARRGVLFVYPFVNPWSWMNSKTVRFVDEIIDVVTAKFNLRSDCRLILRGGSMGGYSALAHSMFSRHKPEAVMALCPVTDLFFHLTERPDLPRSIHDSAGRYDDISRILKDRSPNYHPGRLPDCRYLIVHGVNDKSVSKQAHSDKLVRLMRLRGLDVTYIEDSRMAHGSPIRYETVIAMENFIRGPARRRQIKKGSKLVAAE
jgi:pimeloyl-ACP methyl ester carboxylesterase